jgi:hypothetical protein
LRKVHTSGIFGRHEWSYWKFLAEAATRYRRYFGAAMTLAVMGYHFLAMTQKCWRLSTERLSLPNLAKSSSAAEAMLTPGKIHFPGTSRNHGRPAIRPSQKGALQTCISRCFPAGRHGPKAPQLLFGALRGILVRSPRTRELGDEDRVRCSHSRDCSHCYHG